MNKKLLSLLLALAMAFSLAAPALAAEEETEATVAPYTVPADVEGKLVILHTNDTHGADMAVAGESIGTAGVAQLKKDFEAAGADVLLVSAGDAIMGKPLVSANQGVSAFEFMNAAGYDVMTIGNHELDFGIENLKTLAESAEFDILCADMVDETTNTTVFDAHKIYDLGGVKVGVFGLATPETRTKADASKMPGITFPEKEELYACAQEQVDALEAEGADLIVCLGHLGVDNESVGNRSIDVCENVDGIDLFVDGHSHSTTADITAATGTDSNVVNGTKIVSTGTALANVGVVVYDQETGELTDSLVSAAAYSQVDPEVNELIVSRNDEVQAEYGEKIAETEVDLNGSRSGGEATAVNTGAAVTFPEGEGVRTGETNLGDFAADAILWQARQSLGEDAVDAALTNGGGIRETLAAGDITKLDLLAVFPFGNTVATIDVTGAQLLEALEAATCSTPEAIGAFPQVSGIVFTINTAVAYENGAQYEGSTYYAPAAPGSRVTITEVNGEPFDPEATYTIATNDFTAKGGDTYGVFKIAGSWKDVGVSLEDALINYTTEELGGVITAEQYGESAGRITLISETPAEPEAPAEWADVDQGAWYAEAVDYVIDNGIMGSTVADAKVFAPNGTVTRATVFQTLYNMEGKPAIADTAAEGSALVTGEDGILTWTAFRDVEGAWYADAANWSASVGLASVPQDGLFNGDRNITRAEIATIFARYAEYKGMATASGDLSGYADVADVAEWAQEGMAVAVGSGILSGKPGDLLDPNGNAVRTELATILLNYSKLTPAEEESAAYTEEAVSIEANGRTIPAVVTLPVGEGPFPAVVLNHGHGGSKDENVGFISLAQTLAEAGIASIRMDFPGCGESTEPFTENTLSNMIADSNASKDYLVANYPVDADKLGILGYSMGGRIALEVITAEGNPYKAAVILSGVSTPGEEAIANILPEGTTVEDAIAMAEENGSFDYTTRYGQELSLSAQWFTDMMVGPLANIDNYTGPMLVLHGDKDTVVDDATNKLTVAAYPAAEEVIVPDADHGYGFYSDQPEVTAMVEGTITDFFVEHLEGKISLDAYLASSEYDWFLTGKTSYTIQGKMVSAPTEVYNDLEDVHYTAEANGEDVILKGTSGEEWVSKLEKVMETYTKADGSALTAEDFVADTYIDLQTKAEPDTNYAMFIPADIQVIVETAWGDVLTANRPEVPHGDGDYLVCSVTEDGEPDLTDVWVVNGATFPDTYDMTNAETARAAA